MWQVPLETDNLAVASKDEARIVLIGGRWSTHNLRRHLEARDWVVVEAPGGADAVAVPERTVADVVVADVDFPVVDAPALIRAMKASRATSRTPSSSSDRWRTGKPSRARWEPAPTTTSASQ